MHGKKIKNKKEVKYLFLSVTFQVLTAVKMSIPVVWPATSSRLVLVTEVQEKRIASKASVTIYHLVWCKPPEDLIQN